MCSDLLLWPTFHLYLRKRNRNNHCLHSSSIQEIVRPEWHCFCEQNHALGSALIRASSPVCSLSIVPLTSQISRHCFVYCFFKLMAHHNLSANVKVTIILEFASFCPMCQCARFLVVRQWKHVWNMWGYVSSYLRSIGIKIQFTWFWTW